MAFLILKWKNISFDRRVEQMEAEGVTFHLNTHVGVDITGDELHAKHDAVILAGWLRVAA
jgi:NADPH-dependent glutamate synthase beta subunit-like oxidoreductase